MTEQEERNWLIFCHLGGVLFVYLLNVIIPAAIWLTQRSKSSFVNDQGKEVVNFQISLTIYGLCLLLMALTVIGIPVTIIGFLFLFAFNVVSSIRGTMCASKGQPFKYPLNLRLLN